MKSRFAGARFLFAVLFMAPLLASAGDYAPFEGAKSAWHDGFDRYDFVMDEQTLAIEPFQPPAGEKFGARDPEKGRRRCIVIVPKQPAPGIPWSWSVPHFQAKSIAYILPGSRSNQSLTREEALFANTTDVAKLPRGAPFESADVADNAYPDGKIADEAVRRLQAAKANSKEPFFLAVGFLKPHLPFCAPKKICSMCFPAETASAARCAPRAIGLWNGKFPAPPRRPPIWNSTITRRTRWKRRISHPPGPKWCRNCARCSPNRRRPGRKSGARKARRNSVERGSPCFIEEQGVWVAS